MLLRSIRANRSSICYNQGPDSKLKNLDQSSLLIFSIFSLLVEWLTYILYQYASYFRGAIYQTVFSPLCAHWSFRLWGYLEVIYMTFLETEMKKLGRSTWNDTQQNIVDLYLSSMSQTSCSWKKLSRCRSIKKHTLTHTQAAVCRSSSERCS